MLGESMKSFLPCALAAALLIAACEGNVPCSRCPEVGGRYRMSYEILAGAESCAGPETRPPGELEIAQVAASLKSVVQGVQLTGTIYSSGELSLGGTEAMDGGGSTIHLSGHHLPPSSITDGGTMLSGSYSAIYRRGSSSCVLEASFSGRRQ